MENDFNNRNENFAQNGADAGDLIASDRVDGTSVYDRSGEKLGSISHLMIDKRSGEVEYAVMSFGGFLGMGTDEYALPWKKLEYDTNQSGYVVDITKEQLQDAPRHTPERRDTFERDYYDYVSGYYGQDARTW